MVVSTSVLKASNVERVVNKINNTTEYPITRGVILNFFVCNAILTCITDKTAFQADFIHYIIAGVNTCCTVYTFQLCTVSDILYR